MRKPINDFFLFLLGGALFAAGLFLFTNQVMVDSGFRSFGWRRGWGGWGGFLPFGAGQGFGLLLLPFGVGVALLIGDVNRRIGWFLIWASSAALAVGVLQSLVFNFRTTSLFSLLAMVAMIGGGGALMFRALKDYDADEKSQLKADIDAANRRLNDLTEELDNLKARTERKP